jgi:hypothetical protein
MLTELSAQPCKKIKGLYEMNDSKPSANGDAERIAKEVADKIEAAILLERLRRAQAMTQPLDPASLPLSTKVLSKN